MTYDRLINEIAEHLNDKQEANKILGYKYGVGGLHWCCGKGLFHNVIEIDAKSFYPHILLNWNLLPDWINKEKYKEGLALRMAGDDRQVLKDWLNIPTGRLRMPNSCPLDKERGLTMCNIGQLLIALLREYLESDGFKTIQVNTDCVMISQYDNYKPHAIARAISKWKELTGIPVKAKEIAHLERRM